MKEAAHVIIENARALTGAPNAQIRPSTMTPADSNNDRGREEIHAEMSLPTTTQRDTKKGKQKHTQDRKPT